MIKHIKFATAALGLLLILGISSCKNPGGENSGGSENHDNRSISGTKNSITDTSASRWVVFKNGNTSNTCTVYKDSGLYWKIRMTDNHIADADLKIIDRCLKHLSMMKNPETAPINKSGWKEKGVDDGGRRLNVYNAKGQCIDSFIVGKMEFMQNKSSYYFRRPGNEKVYLIKGAYLDGSVLAPEESYRKKEMVAVDSRFFKKIRIVTPGSNEYYLIEHLEAKWSINGQEAEQNKVNTYARMLSMIQIPAFAAPSDQKSPNASVLIDTEYGPVKLTATQNSNGEWILASSVNIGNYLKLNKAQVNALFPPLSQFTK